jgi:hypothetical protein
MTTVQSALAPTFPDQYKFLYPEDNTYQLFANVVANNVVAYQDDDGVPQTLTLGATSNVKIEAVGELDIYVKDSGDVRFFETKYSGETRTDKQILEISASNSTTTTIIATAGNKLDLSGSDVMSTTIVGGTTMCNDNTKQYFSTDALNGFEFMQPVVINSFLDVDGDGQVRGNFICHSNVYAGTLNVWRDRSNVDPDILTVGYGFNVNSNNQLELIKYSRFRQEGDTVKDIMKKVAVFGHTPMSSNDISDESVSSYTVFDAVTGVGQIDGNGKFVSTQVWTVDQYNKNIYYTEGNVGVGIETPLTKLDINGNIGISNVEIIDVDRNMRNMTSITAAQISSPNILTTSDARLKDIGGELDSIKCLEDLLNVDVYSYTFKSDETKREHNGFLAQQLESIMPHAIVEQAIIPGDETLYKTVDTSFILANIVGAIKELYSLIQTKV